MMKSKHYFIVLSIVFLMGVGTFVYIVGGPTNSDGSNTHGSSSIEGIYITPQELSENPTGDFSMALVLDIAVGTIPESAAPVEDVFVCVYGESGRVLHSQNIGSIDAPADTVNVTIETTEVPRFTTVHHPRFRGIAGEHQVLGYDSNRDPPWASTGTNDLPFDYDAMGWTGCESPS